MPKGVHDNHKGGAPVRHGAKSAEVARAKGMPFQAIALAKQQEVEERLARKGVYAPASGMGAVLFENALRAQVCLDLWFDALAAAHDAGDMEHRDTYLSKAGWMIGVAGREWERFVKIGKEAEGVDAGRVLEAMRHESTD